LYKGQSGYIVVCGVAIVYSFATFYCARGLGRVLGSVPADDALSRIRPPLDGEVVGADIAGEFGLTEDHSEAVVA